VRKLKKREIPLARRRCKWENKITIDIKETEWEGMGWINLVQDRDKWQAVCVW
jgi:hypothetical protein